VKNITDELIKLRVARGRFERLAFIADSPSQCRVAVITGTLPGEAKVETLGEGATQNEAFAIAWNNSANVIAESAEFFRANRVVIPRAYGSAVTPVRNVARNPKVKQKR
jgi:hypothetical protein